MTCIMNATVLYSLYATSKRAAAQARFHKEKYEEYDRLIERLRRENKDLKTSLEYYEKFIERKEMEQNENNSKRLYG